MNIHFAQISSKGQLVIPSELRQQLNLANGTRVSLQREGNTLILRPVTPEFIDSLVGCTRGAGEARERAHRDDKNR